jgi:ferritin-like metal-binding protein YciE
VQRIEEAFAYLEGSYRGKKCSAMEGLVKEGEEIIKEEGVPSVKDAGLIAAAQKVEHYEIASYGTAVEHAKSLGLKEVSQLLQKTLSEEKEADATLTFIATKEVNPAACSEDQAAESKA